MPYYLPLLLTLFLFSLLTYGTLFPGTIVPFIWLFILTTYAYVSDNFLEISNLALFITAMGSFFFFFGCVVGKSSVTAQTAEKTRAHLLTSEAARNFFYAITALGLPFFVARAFSIAAAGPFGSFFIDLRIMLTDERIGDTNAFGIYAYLIPVMFISSAAELIAFLIQKNQPTFLDRLRLYSSIAIGITYVLLFTGRTYVLMFLTVQILIRVTIGGLSIYRAMIIFLGIFLTAFSIFAIALGKGGATEASYIENFSSITETFFSYLVGPTVAFSETTKNSSLCCAYGENIFRTLLALYSKIDPSVQVPALIKEYTYTPAPVNVYTVFHPYYLDFGLPGIAIGMFFIGLAHGILYKKQWDGAHWHIAYIISLYPILMQFYQDQYFNLLSMWLQFFAFITLLGLIDKRISASTLRKLTTTSSNKPFY